MLRHRDGNKGLVGEASSSAVNLVAGGGGTLGPGVSPQKHGASPAAPGSQLVPAL